MKKSIKKRSLSLMPNGIPKYIRCYDKPDTIDRYTVCFTGLKAIYKSDFVDNEYPYVGMSDNPFHPQGVGQHGFNKGCHVDMIERTRPVPIGKSLPHLGKRILFTDLPKDCQKVVIQDYKNYWDL